MKKRIFILGFILLFVLFNPLYAVDKTNSQISTKTGDEISTDEFQSSDDEFESFDDGFERFDNSELSNHIGSQSEHGKKFPSGLKFGLGALLFTVIAGFMVHFRSMRYFRSLFLLSSLVILGFYNGGCPCSISSFQNLWLWIMGQDIRVHSLVWFLSLIPITYFMGRIWCGWVCHLGAFQDFIYRRNDNIKFFKSPGIQKTLKIIQYITFVILMIQLFVTKSNIFIHYDPFKVAFNLTSYHQLGWILLGILLLTSLFIYRPFCRGFCPVGLVLGWITNLPGALQLHTNSKCTSCRLCTKNCLSQSIRYDQTFHSQDCIMCGDCYDKCKKEAIGCRTIMSGLLRKPRKIKSTN
jgi:polyferredoxin